MRLTTDARRRHLTQVAEAERVTREIIAAKLDVYDEEVALADAKEVQGLRAMFGETYPDPVRMLTVGAPIDKLLADPKSPLGEAHSVEFCGGTHVKNSGDIGDFAIISEEAIAKGIRRVVCVSGAVATRAIALAEKISKEVDAETDGMTTAGVARFTNLINDSQIPASAKETIRTKLSVVKKKLVEEEKILTAKLGEVAVAFAKEVLSHTLASPFPLVLSRMQWAKSVGYAALRLVANRWHRPSPNM